MLLDIREIFYRCSIILDIFPVQLKLNIDGDEKKSTLIGRICSILLIIFSLLLLILKCLNHSNKKPIILISNQIIKNKNPIDIPSYTFSNILNINLENIKINSGYPTHNIKINSGYPTHNFINNMSKVENKELLIKSDSISNRFRTNLSDIVKRVGKNQYCKDLINLDAFKKNVKNICGEIFKNSICNDYNFSNISLGGDFVFAKNESIFNNELVFDLPNLLANSYISFKMIIFNSFFNPNEVNGSNNFTDYYEFEKSVDKNIIITITLTKNTLLSDDNILFDLKSIKNHTFYTLKQINVQRRKREYSSKSFEIQRNFILDSVEIIYNRSYVKLDSILASTFTILNIVYFCIAASLNFIESENVNYYLMKRLYYFKKQLPIQKLNPKEIKDNFLFRSANNLNKVKNIELPINNNKKQLKNNLNSSVLNFENIELPVIENNNINKIRESNEIENLKTFSKIKLVDLSNNRISAKFDLIKYFFYKICVCKRDKKYFDSLQLFLIANTVLKHDLNIVNIMKKLIELETIKDLIFSNNQSKLMKIIYNRKISHFVDPEIVTKKLNEKLYEINVNRNELINEFSSPFDDCLYSKDKLDMKIIKRINN